MKGRDTKGVRRMEGGNVERGRGETTPKPAISIGHLGVRVGSRGGSEGAPLPPPRGANVWQLKSTPSRFHLSAIAANRHRRRKPRGVGKTFSVLGWAREGERGRESRVLLFS